MPELALDRDATLSFLLKLLNTPSPTGYHIEAAAAIEQAFSALAIDDLTVQRTHKGTILVTWPGDSHDKPRGLTAHSDTLGLMVKEIKSNGRLALTMLGHFMWNAVENEGITVQTQTGQRFRGTVLPVKASVHIHHDASTQERNAQTMEARLDVRTSCADETRALGINVGDFVFIDPRPEVTDTGFVRSRHLDDKAGLAAVYGAFRALRDSGQRPAQTVTVLFSSHEEVGHGGSSGFSADLHELIVIDMAPVGEGQNSDEFSVGICVKDGSGPYHLELTGRLRVLADQAGIPYKPDIYLDYSSDGSTYWRAGGPAQVALIGPGVDASHAYERTHTDSILHTAHLIACYLLA